VQVVVLGAQEQGYEDRGTFIASPQPHHVPAQQLSFGPVTL